MVAWFVSGGGCFFFLLSYDEAILMLIPDRSAEHSNQ